MKAIGGLEQPQLGSRRIERMEKEPPIKGLSGQPSKSRNGIYGPLSFRPRCKAKKRATSS